MSLFMGEYVRIAKLLYIFLGTDFTNYTEMRKRIREIRVICA